MVLNPVLFKIPLVNAGSDGGFIFQFYGRNRDAGLFKRLLDPDIETGSVRFPAECKYISAETDQRVFDSLSLEIFLEAVGDVAFCDAAKVYAGFDIGKADGVSFYLDVLIADMILCFRNGAV